MTISCGRTRRLLWPDGGPRAASPEVIDAQEHLAGCASCQRFIRDMRTLSDLAASTTPPQTAPADARERLFAAIARARAAHPVVPIPRSRRVVAVIAAASVLVVGAVAGLVFHRGSERAVTSDTLTALVDDHARTFGETRIVSSDAAEVTRWLSRQVHFAATVPALPGAALRGARLCVLGGRRSAVVAYEVDGEALSYFIVPTNDGPDADAHVVQFAHASRNGYHVVSWREPGLLYAMVGIAAPPRLEQLARYCVEQMRVALLGMSGAVALFLARPGRATPSL